MDWLHGLLTVGKSIYDDRQANKKAKASAKQVFEIQKLKLQAQMQQAELKAKAAAAGAPPGAVAAIAPAGPAGPYLLAAAGVAVLLMLVRR